MTDKITVEMTPYEYAIFIAGLYHIEDEPCHYIGPETTRYAYYWAERLQEQHGQSDEDILIK